MKRPVLTFPVNSFILALLVTGSWFDACRAQTAPTDDDAGGPSRTSKLVWDGGTVLGRGVNLPDAREDALKKAQIKVKNYLHGQESPLEWTPSRAFIRKYLLKGPPEPRTDEEKQVDGEKVKCWSWNLVIDARSWHEMQYRDQQARVAGRMAWLGKIIAALVVFFAVVASYIRVDDLTKGYYTGWLRLTAAAALALVGASLYWLS